MWWEEQEQRPSHSILGNIGTYASKVIESVFRKLKILITLPDFQWYTVHLMTDSLLPTLDIPTQ